MRFAGLRSGSLRTVCFLLASLGVGCSDAPPPGPGPGPAPGPATAEVDVKRYELKGQYDWDQSRLLATVDITLSPLESGAKSIELDSAVTKVKTVRIAGGASLPFTTDAAEEKLRVDTSTLPDFQKDVDITLEIDYEAASNESLMGVGARKGDPLDVRALFTFSEPVGARRWMPSHDTPADRAIFSIAMQMPSNEKMIANGDLLADEPGEGGSHSMKYETKYTLPTYLMAFAISDFEVESAMKGDLPVAIWHRRGLQGHYEPVLAETVSMIERYEELLGPYPFEKYVTVHLPAYPATGEENAGISFHFEGAGVEPLGLELQIIAHELSHQWMGDLMTIESWDDLWIKEGMASVLELEGIRKHSNKDAPFTLNGNNFYAVDGEAIRDKSLKPDDKYTSAVYGRAGWLMTQIRSVVGEEAFWKILRRVLDEHKFGAIGTEAFLDAFAEALGPEAAARAKQAVDAKTLPTMTLQPLPDAGAVVTVNDPEGTLVAPFDIAWIAEDGSKRAETLKSGEPFTLKPQNMGEFLVMDPQDRHLTWDAFAVDPDSIDAYQASVMPLIAPTSPAGEAHFLELSSAAQDEVLYQSILPGATPENLSAFITSLDAEWTQAVALRTVCSVASDPSLPPEVAAAWKTTLDAFLPVPPPPFQLDILQVSGYSGCAMFDPVTAFASDWTKLETGLPSGEIDYLRLSFLTAFHLPPPLAMSTWGNVAKQASSGRVRWLAAMEMRTYLNDVDPADLPAWRAFFIELLNETEHSQALQEAIRAVVKLKAPTAAENADALAGLGVALHSQWTRAIHARAVCAAYTLTAGDAAAWSAFVEAQKDAPLHPDAAARLKDPSLCP